MSLSQTLFGNPKGPVELGNPNTCAETKLCLNFILFRLKKWFCYEPDGLYSWLTKARIDFVEDSFPQQTETLVSNKSKCITKISRPTKLLFHALPNCKAKLTLKLDSINTNNSTSVEQNCQPLAQNKFNNCPPTPNLTVHLLWPNKITFARAATRVASNYLTTIIIISRYASALYRKQNHVT